MKAVCTNRKAYHDYHIEETVEAGLVLVGTEVKTLREGRANLKDGYVLIKGGEAFLIGVHIGPYSHGNVQNHEPERTRKLLLKKTEIEKLRGKTAERGYSLVPLKLYFSRHLVKVEIGLVKGKRLFEKRQVIKEREAKKDIRRALKDAVRQ